MKTFASLTILAFLVPQASFAMMPAAYFEGDIHSTPERGRMYNNVRGAHRVQNHLRPYARIGSYNDLYFDKDDHGEIPQRRSWLEADKKYIEAYVLDAVDGSTLKVELPDHSIQHVRLLGADAPMLTQPVTSLTCFAAEARDALDEMASNHIVVLNHIPGFQRDRSKNLVRYVNLDGIDLGEWMIRRGHAFADRTNGHPKTLRYILRERNARLAKKGIWSHTCSHAALSHDDRPYRLMELNHN